MSTAAERRERTRRQLPRTARGIAALRPESKAVDWFDASVKGASLALHVSPGGAKTWYLFYAQSGRPQRFKLGAYPALSLADARMRAWEERQRIDRDGADPAAERRAAKKAPQPERLLTFEDFVPIYERFAKGKKTTWKKDQQKIKKHLLPYWKDTPLRSITRRDVHEVLDRLVERGMTTGANRVQALVSRIFTVALDRGLIDAHPAARLLKRHTEQPRDRVLTDDELRALWARLEAVPGRASDCLKLRLVLGQRLERELMPMTWAGRWGAELDLDSALWIIPRERTKNRKQPHTVPLPATALAILKRRRAEVPEDNPRVFPRLSGSSDDYRALSAIHGGAYEWKDLRRTLATRLAGLGFNETTIGRVLNHAKVSVTAKHYNVHAYDEEKRQALGAWDRELQRILRGEPRSKADVVPLQRGA